MKRKLILAATVAAFATAPFGAFAQQSGTTQAQPDSQTNQQGTTTQQQQQQQQNTAQQQDSTQQQQDGQQAELQQQDRQFVQKAAASNKAEIELSRMASEQANSQEVKDFAQQMIDDHTQVGDELKNIVEQKNVQLPDEMSQEGQQAQQQLSDQSGAQFDRTYMEQMVSDHEEAVQLFEEQANNGQDQELKQFAESTLPKLQEHLDQAQQIEQQLGEQTTAGAAGTTDTTGTSGTTSGTATGTATGDQQAARPDNPLSQMTSEDLIGKSVVNANGEEVGEINDIVISGQDRVVRAVISVGGFLGIGEKNVAVPFEQLRPGEDEAVLATDATQEEIESMPAYEEGSGEFQPYPRNQALGGNGNNTTDN